MPKRSAQAVEQVVARYRSLSVGAGAEGFFRIPLSADTAASCISVEAFDATSSALPAAACSSAPIFSSEVLRFFRSAESRICPVLPDTHNRAILFLGSRAGIADPPTVLVCNMLPI